MRHRTPEQQAELQGLRSQLLDNNEALDRAVAKLGTLDGASVSDITNAMRVLRKDGIAPDVAAMGALDDRITEAINHARILARALSPHGAGGGAEQYRASGGPAQGRTWVGAEGPELLDLPPGDGPVMVDAHQTVGRELAGAEVRHGAHALGMVRVHAARVFALAPEPGSCRERAADGLRDDELGATPVGRPARPCVGPVPRVGRL